MNIRLILSFMILNILSSCQEGSDQIQRQREVEIEREQEYDTRKNPLHPTDEIKR
jgi:hypothetical protein